MTSSPGGDADLDRRLAAVSGRADNADGSVRVTATAHGALVDLRLDRRAFELGPERLGAEIVRLTARAAVAALRTELAELANLLPDLDVDQTLGGAGTGAGTGTDVDAGEPRRRPPRAS
ncbi:YbaB/EbfC family nucleoid-associated protein [Streptoalloteichus hindustanus]|uniref:YbaB/EbfC DNA-binding family protein n=1 Tax=Streptoalloteichus hindustanus TaxID=2017 RepID=A0A1M5KAM3_STRHI|nr:YbaB/EbfC family nucleoid-associated protein [Streptoalloteichus hindustanus]SHG49896.1 hypothetical protein SAMN05444320_109205 [Streptoalloteichus hindustanus]